ncbi:hypothetical protein BB559_001255 [Furculomyces boomerangus]|uniref:PX domain-containing protein n=1 Tax=Furculomyces boomerangus TaxID=61424 RepID=A0A2T9Z2J3_9FUNG|nr:hypothetical protein BB559_001255 [Furculomyces boomerangus]
MFGDNLDDVIDPFADESVHWKNLSQTPRKSQEQQKPSFENENATSSDRTAEWNPSLNQEHFQNPLSETRSRSSWESSQDDKTADNIRKSIEVTEKQSINAEPPMIKKEENPDENGSVESSPKISVGCKKQAREQRPLLFRRNMNRTRVLLSGSNSNEKSTFIDPLSENVAKQNSLSPTLGKGSPNQHSNNSPNPNNNFPAPINSSNLPTTYKKPETPKLYQKLMASTLESNDPSDYDTRNRGSYPNSDSDSQIPKVQLTKDDILDENETQPENQEIPEMKITVSEPIKISDSLSSHTVYKISTRTNSSLFKKNEFVVRRRYRDFEWLYQQLYYENPGVIIPPIPEKQSFGRFEQDFIENRRIGLQTHLDRVSTHHLLYKSKSFIIFLQSEEFALESKTITESRKDQINISSGFGDIFGSSKYLTRNDTFADKLKDLELLEVQLKSLLKSLEASNKQRDEISLAHFELGEALLAISNAESHFANSEFMDLSGVLSEISTMQQRLRQLQKKIAKNTSTYFCNIAEEYIRTINSAKNTFLTRVKAHTKWKTMSDETEKRKRLLNQHLTKTSKLQNQQPSSQATISALERSKQLKNEVQWYEIQENKLKVDFESISGLLQEELERNTR